MARTARAMRRKRKAGDSSKRKGKGKKGGANAVRLPQRIPWNCLVVTVNGQEDLRMVALTHHWRKPTSCTATSRNMLASRLAAPIIRFVCAIQGLLNNNKLALLAPVTRSQLTMRPEDPVGTKAMSDAASDASKSSAVSKRSLAI